MHIGFEPRKWQLEALEQWVTSNAGVVSVVTGGGKTSFALLAFESLIRRNPDLQLLVLVPTLALLDQWVIALQCDLSVHPEMISTYSGEGKPKKPNVCNIAVINTARSLTKALTSTGKWMLVVDECHRVGSSVNARSLQGEFFATLGLSATPVREFDDGFAELIEPVLGQLIFEYDYLRARQDGVISDFDIENFEIPLTTSESAEYNKLTRRIAIELKRAGSNHDSGSIEKLRRLQLQRAAIANSARWRIPSAAAVAKRWNGKMIVFHERIEAANEIAILLDKNGRRVEVYHSQIYPPRRREALRRFRVGISDTLVTCRALDEGLNVPSATVALIASSTRSRRQRIQRLGRVLRADTPGKRAVVVTLFATPPERKLLEVEQSGLQGVANVRWFSSKGAVS